MSGLKSATRTGTVTGKVKGKRIDAERGSFVMESDVGYWVCEIISGNAEIGHAIKGEFLTRNLDDELGISAENLTTGEPMVVYVRFFGGRAVATINLAFGPVAQGNWRR